MSTSNDMIIAVANLLGIGKNAYIVNNEEGIKAFFGRFMLFFQNTDVVLEFGIDCFLICGKDFILTYTIKDNRVSSVTIK